MRGRFWAERQGSICQKIVRLLVGNPLIMKEMVKYVPDAGPYAPVTVLVDEREDGVHLSYDAIESLLARYGNLDGLAVARELDSKTRAFFETVRTTDEINLRRRGHPARRP
jgi:hypothetical protein